MSEQITISWEAASPTPLRYVTKITKVGAAALLHTSNNDVTSFEITANFGDKIHQETRAIYGDGPVVVEVKDIFVPFSNSVADVEVQFPQISCLVAATITLTVGGFPSLMGRASPAGTHTLTWNEGDSNWQANVEIEDDTFHFVVNCNMEVFEPGGYNAGFEHLVIGPICGTGALEFDTETAASSVQPLEWGDGTVKVSA